MAVRLSTTSTVICHHLVFPNPLAHLHFTNRVLAYSFHPRPLIPPPVRSFRFFAVSSGHPPPEPESDPSPSDDPDPPSGTVASKISRLQDKVQIFFAVLFWMSLFFWASAWDGSNNNKKNERPDKGSRFRR